MRTAKAPEALFGLATGVIVGLTVVCVALKFRIATLENESAAMKRDIEQLKQAIHGLP